MLYISLSNWRIKLTCIFGLVFWRLVIHWISGYLLLSWCIHILTKIWYRVLDSVFFSWVCNRSFDEISSPITYMSSCTLCLRQALYFSNMSVFLSFTSHFDWISQQIFFDEVCHLGLIMDIWFFFSKIERYELVEWEAPGWKEESLWHLDGWGVLKRNTWNINNNFFICENIVPDNLLPLIGMKKNHFTIFRYPKVYLFQKLCCLS